MKLKIVIMESLFFKIQKKYKNLNNNEKVAAVTFLSLFIGVFLFISGVSIGEAFYKITH